MDCRSGVRPTILGTRAERSQSASWLSRKPTLGPLRAAKGCTHTRKGRTIDRRLWTVLSTAVEGSRGVIPSGFQECPAKLGVRMAANLPLNVRRFLFACGQFSLLAAAASAQIPARTYPSLHPSTPDGRVRADFFDRAGVPRLAPGSTLNEIGSLGPQAARPDYEPFLTELVCTSDAVVAGFPLTSQAFLTPSESMIFTDYGMAVETWVRPNLPSGSDRPRSSSVIIVSLRGGKLIVEPGQTLEVASQPALELSKRYVLFLKLIPDTSSYRLSFAPFVVEASGPAIQTERLVHRLPDALIGGKKPMAAFVSDLRKIAAGCRK